MCALFQGLKVSDVKNIAILRALQLGDMLNAVPAFRALRAAFPHAHIVLVGLPWEEEFVKRFHSYLDEFIHFPGIPGFPEQPADLTRFPSFLTEMQSRRFDLAIQMQGSGDIANTLISLWGAKTNAGFYKPGQHCLDAETFLEYPENEHERWRHLRLIEFLGIPLRGDELVFPLFAEDREELRDIEQRFNLRDDYICIHPGARKRERRWPVENFASVADGLASLGFQIALTGSEAETNLTASVAQHMKMPVIDLAGQTSLGGLAALISRARLVVSNDTGISHVATALKSPSVILFSASDMDRWAPADTRLHKVLWPALDMSASDVLTEVESHLRNIYAHPIVDREGVKN